MNGKLLVIRYCHWVPNVFFAFCTHCTKFELDLFTFFIDAMKLLPQQTAKAQKDAPNVLKLATLIFRSGAYR
jgi:hypothetical protein